MDKGRQKTHTVISMTQQVTENQFAPLAQVEAYWEALRGSRLMPTRTEIDPRGIERALENSFIVERIAPGIARICIAGSHLSDLMGMEVRGMPLTAFISPSSRRQVSDTLEEVFQKPATCTLNLQSAKSTGMPALDARLLLLPLKSDLGDVSRILGALVAVGDIGRSPRRFEVTGTALRPILSEEETVAPLPLEPARHEPQRLVETPGFAEAKTPFETVVPRREAPYLRLVKSDD